MNKTEIMKILYCDENYDLAEKLCSEREESDYLFLRAEALFFGMRFNDAERLFVKLNMPVRAGYCKLYAGDAEEAQSIWSKLPDDSPVIMWCKALAGFVKNKKFGIPTFFQLRNFYEADLDMLLSSGLNDYAENLINSVQYFVQINPEVYKFTARVLLTHGYADAALNFINAGKNIVFDDSELHFIEAEIHLAKKDRNSAIHSLNTVLQISPEYYPAKLLLEKLK